MKYILDSNIALKWLLEEELSDKARSLRYEFNQGTHDFLSPDVFLVEAAHALTRAQRQGRITATEVESFMGDLLTSLPRFSPYTPLLPRAIEISIRARIGVYDCLYVALAEREECELLTADGKLIKNLQSIYANIRPLASLP